MMNIFFKWLGWFVLCVVLQSALVPHIAIVSIMPDLPFIVLFFLATKYGMMQGVYAGFFLGLSHDLFSPEMLGQNALAKSVTGFMCGIFNERVIRLDPVTRGALIFVAFLVNDLIIMLVHAATSDDGSGVLWTELLAVTLPRAAYTLVFALIPFVWTSIIKPPRMAD